MLRNVLFICFLVLACERDEPIERSGIDVPSEPEPYSDEWLLNSEDSFDQLYLFPPPGISLDHETCGIISSMFLDCSFYYS